MNIVFDLFGSSLCFPLPVKGMSPHEVRGVLSIKFIPDFRLKSKATDSIGAIDADLTEVEARLVQYN